MLQLISIFTPLLSAAGNARAAVGGMGIYSVSTPPPERFRTNNIRADEARNHQARLCPVTGCGRAFLRALKKQFIYIIYQMFNNLNF